MINVPEVLGSVIVWIAIGAVLSFILMLVVLDRKKRIDLKTIELVVQIQYVDVLNDDLSDGDVSEIEERWVSFKNSSGFAEFFDEAGRLGLVNVGFKSGVLTLTLNSVCGRDLNQDFNDIVRVLYLKVNGLG